MRTLKFRAWDTRGMFCPNVPEKHYKPRMIFNVQDTYDDFETESSFGDILRNNRYILMQSTGLFDKNGVEIYEGDIVKFGDWKPKEIFFEGENGFAGFRLRNTDCFLMGYDTKRMEIIGNIYEHPHLIEGESK